MKRFLRQRRCLGWMVVAVCAACSADVNRTPSPANMTNEPHNQAALPRNITVAQAASLRDKGAFILDVREVSEWQQAHVPGSTLIPLGQLAARTGDVPRNRDVVVICRSGNRSQRGRDILLRAGVASVTSMDGGIIQWQAAGHPVVNGGR